MEATCNLLEKKTPWRGNELCLALHLNSWSINLNLVIIVLAHSLGAPYSAWPSTGMVLTVKSDVSFKVFLGVDDFVFDILSQVKCVAFWHWVSDECICTVDDSENICKYTRAHFFYLRLRKVLANERKLVQLCYVFCDWLRPCFIIDRKLIQVNFNPG